MPIILRKKVRRCRAGKPFSMYFLPYLTTRTPQTLDVLSEYFSKYIEENETEECKDYLSDDFGYVCIDRAC
jgi:hypothetical protein